MNKRIDVNKVEFMEKNYLPRLFRDAVRLLRRPYLPISVKEYEILLECARQVGSDIFVWENEKYTFGEADNGFYIMPLISGDWNHRNNG